MKILKNINYDDILFIDIETVKGERNLEEGTPLYDSWAYKARYSSESDKFGDKNIIELFDEKAALYAEFSKVVCVTIGKIKDGAVSLKTYSSHDEKEMLKSFGKVLDNFVGTNPSIRLCGHAITGFDIPFLMRRFIVNRLPIPILLDVAHLKPWELTSLDTLSLWKGTGFYSASLMNISTAFGLPSPKSDINGSETSNVYYNEENGLERIASYCERDVHTVCNVLRIMKGDEPLDVTQAPILERVPSTLEKLASGATITKEEKEKIEAVKKKLKASDKEKADFILNTIENK